MKQYIGISRDHSGSMRGLTHLAAADYNLNLEAIQRASRDNNLDTIMNVVKCGVGHRATVDRETVNSNVQVLRPMSPSAYIADGNATPLFDSVGELIELMENVPDANDIEVSFLIMVITDGGENSSKRWKNTLASKIQSLQRTDRWTFAFRVPKGYAHYLTNLGIPSGNIMEWEQTAEGISRATASTQSAIGSYYATKSVTRGAFSTDKFFADLNNVSKTTIKQELKDISSDVMEFRTGLSVEEISVFMHKMRGTYTKGTCYYQLTKTEKVQQSKKILIRDKRTHKVYAGQNARDLLNLPHYGEIKLVPGNLGDYDVFVQSTSSNRNLMPRTDVIYYPY